ncbi:hypothetical protein GLOIN_2v1486266 [Rhizophagus irregularis DAOM 181602=DAOM 197198]|uniref:Uncharacterized protein n=1 Tax=Rhizophagus irregularis (strain DAOM 181602 / DAOM 197198 / MUCL 43194) TaxID=747089 RepID=A0A2P4P7W1_RHIID|nr:hypothetical protein GLOIN_2v1486266 [Rhizophagus irregularis DAOM 181602=DAOM 197198]POG61437.1 hypothetical protein GLOIN_2v1486266 [Rhizophagus irregularis DAOM 181602=DAOM 197198]|eukprot:XP_025168303.1 hypothetical protein GLOIN_2v1486266 [Rhizophagus irregularis DAOM 181602=DAOM 197198]
MINFLSFKKKLFFGFVIVLLIDMNQLQLFALDQYFVISLVLWMVYFRSVFFLLFFVNIGRLNDRQHLRFWVCSLDKFQIEDYGCIDGNLWFHLHPLTIVD